MSNEEIPFWGNVNLADFETFLAVMRLLERDGHDEPATNLKKLTEEKIVEKGDWVSYTTIIGRLERIKEFVFATDRKRRYGVPLPIDASRSAYEVFFQLEAKGGVAATVLARKLKSRFETLLAVAREIEKAAGEEEPRVLHIGCTHVLGVHLASAAFSGWPRHFPNERFDLSVGRSIVLAPQLRAGILDLVVVHGQANMNLPDLTFHGLGYKSRFVLACHPDRVSQLLGKEKGQSARRASKARPQYEELAGEIRLEQIDYDRPDTPQLTYVTTLGMPKSLSDAIKRLQPKQKCQVASRFDEAYAMARSGHAFAVLPEVFCQRPGVEAFRLLPSKDFEFELGVLYCKQDDQALLSWEAVRAMYFLQKYLAEFQREIRRFKPPCLGDDEYESFCEGIKKELLDPDRDWEAFGTSKMGILGRIERKENKRAE